MQVIAPITLTDAMLSSSNVAEADAAAWSATTLYATGDTCMVVANTHKVYTATLGKKSTVTMTIASPGVVTWTAHGLAADTPIAFTTTGALPTGLVAGTTYYLKTVDANSFQLAATAGGTAINTSGTQSGVHTCGLASNYGKDPTASANAAVWTEVSPTNRWAMFDQAVGTVTTNASTIVVTLAPGQIVDSLLVMDVAGASVRLQQYNGGPAIFDQTITLGDGAPVGSWSEYYFTPLAPNTSALFTGLMPYAGATYTLTITAPTTAACGTLLIGSMYDVGLTLAGVQMGIISYSKKDTNVYGKTSVLKRGYAKKFSTNLILENTRLRAVSELLSSLKDTPCAWLVADTANRPELVVYGFYKDWQVAITYPTHSEVSLSIEGLV